MQENEFEKLKKAFNSLPTQRWLKPVERIPLSTLTFWENRIKTIKLEIEVCLALGQNSNRLLELIAELKSLENRIKKAENKKILMKGL